MLSELLILFHSIISFAELSTTELSSIVCIPSIIASDSFILPPLLHSFSIKEACRICAKIFQISRRIQCEQARLHQLPFSFRNSGLHKRRFKQSKGALGLPCFGVQLTNGIICSFIVVTVTSFIPCQCLEAPCSDFKIILALFRDKYRNGW
jgi:hypothetical protein